MSLELQLQQKQILSQRMIQSVQILQMTSQELESYIEELALENPAMDVERQAAPAESSIEALRQSFNAGEQEHYLSQRQNNDDDYDPKDSWNFSTEQGETLRDYLWSQLDPRSYSKVEVLILYYLLENLDERGYLTEDTGFVAEHFDVSEDKIEEMISVLQKLEPAGVCARSLEECLLIQLQMKGILDDNLRRIITEHLELVAKNKITALAGSLGISAAEAASCCDIIRTLDPKPGSRFYHQEEIQYITPDVYILPQRSDPARFAVTLNNGDSPNIFVNSYYQKLYTDTADMEVREYLEKKIRQTEWLRQCISQRQATLTRVSEEILKAQLSFFEKGPDALQPLKLAEVAEAIGMHESTVSRAIDKKYLQCSYGIFPMSYFFQRKATARDTRSAAMSDQSFTSAAVKQALKEIIATESSRKPYSDRILSEKLAERGIQISRRTVAKYRDEAGIPDASGRKTYND